jgi:hypothetical protein
MAAGDVGKIEAGRLQPYESQLQKIARALGVPAANAETLLAEDADDHAVITGSSSDAAGPGRRTS